MSVRYFASPSAKKAGVESKRIETQERDEEVRAA